MYEIAQALASNDRPILSLYPRQQEIWDLIRNIPPAPILANDMSKEERKLAILEYKNTPGVYDSIVIGGAFGGGKTYGALVIFSTLALKYPGSHWTIVRETLKRCKDTILKDFLKFFNGIYATFNKSESLFTFHNGSQIQFKGENLKEDADLDGYKSYSTNGFYIEQAEEVSNDFYEMALARAGRHRIPNMPPAIVLSSVNPTPLWPKSRWYDNQQAGTLELGTAYIPMRIIDNPTLYNDAAYMAKFDKMDRKTRKMYLEGDWSVLNEDEAWQIFSWEHMALAQKRQREAEDYGPCTAIGVDPAFEGEDEMIIVPRHGKWVMKPIAQAKTKSGKEIKDRIKDNMHNQHTAVNVDVTGVGQAVKEYADEFINFNSIVLGAKAMGRDETGLRTFANVKAKIAWYVRERLHPEHPEPIGLPDDPGAIADLAAMRYDDTAGKIKVQSKKEIKKRLGRSPDRGEAIIYSFYDEAYGGFSTQSSWGVY